MKILTKEIENEFKKQGYTGDKKPEDVKIILKLFGGGACSWYLYEHIEDDIYMAYVNLGDLIYAECGTVSLNELMSIKFPPFGLGIERDMYFGEHTLKEVIDIVKDGGNI